MTCFRLPVQEIVFAFSLAIFRAGSSIAARMATIAITIKSSINVNLIIAFFPFFIVFSSSFLTFLCKIFIRYDKLDTENRWTLPT